MAHETDDERRGRLLAAQAIARAFKKLERDDKRLDVHIRDVLKALGETMHDDRQGFVVDLNVTFFRKSTGVQQRRHYEIDTRMLRAGRQLAAEQRKRKPARLVQGSPAAAAPVTT